jgi:DNA-binding protein Fis
MWSWIFKVAIVSFLFIFLIHYLYSFFKTTLTSPKVKDLVNKPMRKYDSIYDSLQNSQGYGYMDEQEGENSSITKILKSNPSSTQNPVKQSMKDELKKYLSELSGSSGSGNKMSDLNTNTNANANTNTKPVASPSIPDFAMSNMSSSSFSSSYSEF